MFCPMSSKSEKERQCAEYPKYMNAYIRAFDRMIEKRKSEGKETSWKSGKECFEWWIEKEAERDDEFPLFNPIDFV